jgi:hypothetical protein
MTAGMGKRHAVEECRRLRATIAELEAEVRAGDAERHRLRRQLAGPALAAGTELEDVEPAECADVAAPPARSCRSARVRLPRFDRVEGELEQAPAHVAAAAVRIAAALAVGDHGAWQSVKRAVDVHPPVLMARVGLHHRLLFHLEANALVVDRFVTREGLMHALKHHKARS